MRSGASRALAAVGASALLVLAVAAHVAAEEEEVLEAEPILVTTERGEARVYEDRAVETQVIPVEEIEATASSNVADVVKRYPGFRTQQRIQGEDAVVSIEGLPPEYTKILVDGQRYTGRLGEVDDLADLPVTCVEKVELLRGSQGIRYGTDAGGGVVDVTTRRAPAEGGNVQLEGGGGDDGNTLGSLALTQRLGPVGATLCYTHGEIDGYDPRTDDEGVFVNIGGEDSEERTDDAYTTFELPLRDDLHLFTNLGYRREEQDFVEPDGEDLGDLRFGRALGHAGLQWLIGDTADWRAELVYYRGVTESGIARDYTLREDLTKLDTSASLYFDTGPVGNLLIGGVDLRHPRLDLHEAGLPFDPDASVAPISFGRDVEEDFTSAGYYVQGEHSYSDWLQLVLGLRLETHSQFSEKLLPQVALRITPLDWLALRLQWGRNYRTPSLRDLYQPDSPQLGGAYFLGGNPALEPENSESWRVGVEIEPDPRVSLAVTGYWNDIDDFIRSLLAGQVQLGESPVTGLPPDSPFCRANPSDPKCGSQTSPDVADIFRPQNLDSVRTRGVEAQLDLHPFDFLDLRAGYTYQDTHVDSQLLPDLKELPNEPEHTVDLGAELRTVLPGTRIPGPQLGLTARWRGEALIEVSGTGFGTFTSTRRSDPSWQVDARVTQKVWKGLELYVDVFNATDEEIVDSYEVRGRYFFAGLRFRGSWD